MIHNCHLIGNSQRFKLIMRYIHKRCLKFILQINQLDQHFFTQLQIKRSKWLIKQ